MSEDQFEHRGRVLEDMFFHKTDQALLEKLKHELAEKEARDQLSALSGITNEQLLDTLVSHNVRAETLACVSLIPLVLVAWADDKLDEEERLVVLRACHEKGLGGNESAMALVEAWLSERPDETLFETWRSYLMELAETLSPDSYEHLKHEVIEQARQVTHAAGGFLGIVNPESRSEKLILKKLRGAFG